VSAESLIEVYRDAFLQMLKDGKTHAEAMLEFDTAKFDAAMIAEIESGAAKRRFNWRTREWQSASGQVTLLELGAKALRESTNEMDLGQAIELWMEGWTSEPQRPDADVMSWYWRRPSRRPGRPGRRYLSTNQAYNAMQKGKP
jgi:hypothetical protein